MWCGSLQNAQAFAGRALWSLLQSLDHQIRQSIRSIAIDGTSSTAILVDALSGASLAAPKLYNEAQAQQAVDLAAQIAPQGHTATSSTSTLAKLLSWHLGGQLEQASQAAHALCSCTIMIRLQQGAASRPRW